jgi:hypothetical protein
MGVQRRLQRTLLVQGVQGVRVDLHLGHARPPGLRGQFVPVLLREQPDRGRLDPQGEVLADQHHLASLVGVVGGHREDPGIVVSQAEPRGQHPRIRVVQLDVQEATGVVDRDRHVESAVAGPDVIEEAQRLAGEESELGVVPLGLQFGDDHHRHDDLVLGEVEQRVRIGQQHRGVDHVAAHAGCRAVVEVEAGCGLGHVGPFQSGPSERCVHSAAVLSREHPVGEGVASGVLSRTPAGDVLTRR